MAEAALPVLVGGAASALGNYFGTQSMANAAKQSAALQQQRFNQAVSYEQPFMQGGQNSLNLYNNATGANGAAAQQDYYNNFQNDPGFQAGVNYGLAADTGPERRARHGSVGQYAGRAAGLLAAGAVPGVPHKARGLIPGGTARGGFRQRIGCRKHIERNSAGELRHGGRSGSEFRALGHWKRHFQRGKQLCELLLRRPKERLK